MLATLACVAVVGAYFSVLLAVWLVGLAALGVWRPAWAVAILIIALPIDQDRPVAGIYVSFSEFQLAVALSACLGRRDWRRLDWRPLLWGLPFVAAVAISGLIHVEAYKVFPHCVRASEMFLACFLAGNVFGESEKDRSLALGAIATAALLFTAVGAAQVFFPWGAHAQERPAGLWGVNLLLRPESLLGNTNQFAGFLLLLFPFQMIRWAALAGRPRRWLWAYLALFTLGGIALTGSRAALAAALLTALTAPLLVAFRALPATRRPETSGVPPWWRRRWSVLGIHAAALVLLVAVGLRTERVRQPLQKLVRNVQLRTAGGLVKSFREDRLPLYRAGLEIWADDPLFGAGPGRWEESLKAWVEAHPEGRAAGVAGMVHAHNLYVQTGAALGAAGLAALLFWWGRLAWEWRRRRDLWALSGTALMVGFFAFGFFDVLFPSLAMELGWLLGLCRSGQVIPASKRPAPT